MKIEILQSVLYDRTRYATGDVIDVSDEMATALVGAGLARGCDVPKAIKSAQAHQPKKASNPRKSKIFGIDAAFADMPEVLDGD